MNVTPTSSVVHIHHDDNIVVSTARAAKDLHDREALKILKLWMVWPPDHMLTLASIHPRAGYSDTEHSLTQWGGAVWFAQIDGDTVIVPEDLPHSTVTVERCYLIGSTYVNAAPLRPSCIPADMAAGSHPEASARRHLCILKRALTQSQHQSYAFMLNFYKLAHFNLPALRNHHSILEEVIAAIAEDARFLGLCVSCGVLGSLPGSPETVDHVREHLAIGGDQKALRFKKRKRQ